MKWIAAITLIAIAAGCGDTAASHRNYIITQSQLENEDPPAIFIEQQEQ